MASATEVDATCLYAVQTVVRYVISYTYWKERDLYWKEEKICRKALKELAKKKKSWVAPAR